jgi:hypothetical protein
MLQNVAAYFGNVSAGVQWANTAVNSDYNIYALASSPATATNNFSSTNICNRAAIWTGSANFDDFCWHNVPGTGLNPNMTLALTHSGGGSGTVTLDLTAATAGVKLASVIGPATAPSGACTVTGAWVFSQDGHATFCSAGTWVTKI